MSSAPTKTTLRLGTRRSPLALAQSSQVAAALEASRPGLQITLVPITTRGDREKGPLAPLGGKGLFTEELERGLLDGSLDLAVHSLKDLPVAVPEGLAVAAFPERADPRDVLISEVGDELDALPAGAVLRTGSLRRRAQVLAARPDLDVQPTRGNVDTRVRRWRESGDDGLILAAAGLARLGMTDLPATPIDPDVMVPAPGQGILALQVKAGGEAQALCSCLDHPATAAAAEAERALLAALGGDCTLPFGAWARHDGDEPGRLRMTAVLASLDGTHNVRADVTLAKGADPRTLGARCYEAMRRAGVEDLLAALGQARAHHA